MGRIVVSVTALIFFLFPYPAVFPEVPYSKIVLYRQKKGEATEIRNNFKIDDIIHANFIFTPKDKESAVEFRWFNPQNTREQTYFELVTSPLLRKRNVVCWLILQPKFPEKIIGSKFSGRWRLEVWVNNRRAAEKVFDVGN